MTGLKYRLKDIVQAVHDREVQAIAHQANCWNTMKSGIAPVLAKAFPPMYEADQATYRGDALKLGTVSYDYIAEGILGFNLYGQYDFSRFKQDTQYAHVRNSLKEMVTVCIGAGVFSVGLPKIGCGLGGGDWGIVSNIIEEELRNFDVTIYVIDEKEIPLDTSY